MYGSSKLRGGCLALALCILSATAAAEQSPVVIQITGLQDVSGDLYLTVYDSEDEWLGDNVVLQRKVDIEDARDGELVTVQIELAAGDYALSIFYDRNGNGKLDANFFGIPREPVAVSNNARPRFGPPKYEDAIFSIGAESVLQRIDMTGI